MVRIKIGFIDQNKIQSTSNPLPLEPRPNQALINQFVHNISPSVAQELKKLQIDYQKGRKNGKLSNKVMTALIEDEFVPLWAMMFRAGFDTPGAYENHFRSMKDQGKSFEYLLPYRSGNGNILNGLMLRIKEIYGNIDSIIVDSNNFDLKFPGGFKNGMLWEKFPNHNPTQEELKLLSIEPNPKYGIDSAATLLHNLGSIRFNYPKENPTGNQIWAGLLSQSDVLKKLLAQGKLLFPENIQVGLRFDTFINGGNSSENSSTKNIYEWAIAIKYFLQPLSSRNSKIVMTQEDGTIDGPLYFSNGLLDTLLYIAYNAAPNKVDIPSGTRWEPLINTLKEIYPYLGLSPLENFQKGFGSSLNSQGEWQYNIQPCQVGEGIPLSEQNLDQFKNAMKILCRIYQITLEHYLGLKPPRMFTSNLFLQLFMCEFDREIFMEHYMPTEEMMDQTFVGLSVYSDSVYLIEYSIFFHLARIMAWISQYFTSDIFRNKWFVLNPTGRENLVYLSGKEIPMVPQGSCQISWRSILELHFDEREINVGRQLVLVQSIYEERFAIKIDKLFTKMNSAIMTRYVDVIDENQNPNRVAVINLSRQDSRASFKLYKGRQIPNFNLDFANIDSSEWDSLDPGWKFVQWKVDHSKLMQQLGISWVLYKKSLAFYDLPFYSHSYFESYVLNCQFSTSDFDLAYLIVPNESGPFIISWEEKEGTVSTIEMIKKFYKIADYTEGRIPIFVVDHWIEHWQDMYSYIDSYGIEQQFFIISTPEQRDQFNSLISGKDPHFYKNMKNCLVQVYGLINGRANITNLPPLVQSLFDPKFLFLQELADFIQCNGGWPIKLA